MNFESFAEQHGLIIDHVVHDRWTRVPTTDKPHSKNGAYIWDGQAGAVQNWALHEKPIPFRGERDIRITESERQKKREKIEADRKVRFNRAIKKAKFILDNAVKMPHPYMASKGFVNDKHWVWNGLLVVPMRIHGALVGCQLISQDGSKKFLSGQVTKGAEAIVDAKGQHILCEGYATAMSLRKALKYIHKRYTIHVCFSAGNIKEIAKRYPQSLIIADNDSVGIRVAKETGHPFWSSPVAGEDFNDFELRVGVKQAGHALIEAGLLVASE